MDKELDFEIGFSESEILESVLTASRFTVKLKAWNGKSFQCVFTDVLGVKQLSCTGVSRLVQSDDMDFLLECLQWTYEEIPDTHPYHAFYFLNDDETAFFKIIAASVKVSVI